MQFVAAPLNFLWTQRSFAYQTRTTRQILPEAPTMLFAGRNLQFDRRK
jgi:hypothetical protein